MRKSKWTEEKLAEAVESSLNYSEVMRKLGLNPSGGSHRIIKSKIKNFNIDTSHFTGMGWCRGEIHKAHIKKFITQPLSEILVENSTYTSTHKLKIRLINEGFLENKCSECGISKEWNNKPLSLQLDHKDGCNTNNKIENLRLLCPNCHSQTETYCGKNRKTNKCSDCETLIRNNEVRCKKCRFKDNKKVKTVTDKVIESRIKSRKVERPTKEQLKILLWQKPTSQIAKEYGIADNTIAAWAKSYELSKPPRGYWKTKCRNPDSNWDGVKIPNSF